MKKKVNKTKIRRVAVTIIFLACLLVMRGYDPNFQALSNGAETLDMRFHYSSIEAYKLFDTIGAHGRLLYIRILLIDFVFITSFALVQNFILKPIIGNALLKTRWRCVLAISYLRGLSDVIENISLLIMINRFPSELPRLVTFSSFFTTLKFIFLGLWLVSIPILIVVRTMKRKELSHE
jgi:hypothetical protein